MSETNSVRRILQFGTFEVDLREMELRQDGLRVKLRDQSFLILEALLERPGELVTRDDLRKRLWPADTFVDFDHSLNAAMKRLRDALGDDPDNPRFIETVPKRGYRFLAPVNGAHRVSLNVDPVPNSDLVPAAAPPTVAAKSRLRSWRRISAFVFAALVCSSLALYFYPRERTAQPSRGLVEFNPIPFTSLLGQERSPTFSPDGSQIAFAWNGNTRKDGADRGFDIYLKTTGSETLIQLTHHPAEAISLSWSPDGAQIAFQRLAGSESGVYLVPALGGSERRLRSTSAQPMGLSWSRDGKWIAFADSPVTEGSHKLNLISVDSLEIKPIPHMSECQEEIFPAFSPDGKLLAYFCIPQPGRFALYDIDPTGGSSHLIGRYAGWAEGIAWSSDKQKLIVARHVEGIKFSELDEVMISDGQLEKLPFGETGGAPAISPGGDKLAFEIWHFIGVDIWKRSLIPRAAPKKIIGSTQASMFPQYSADGKRIVFGSNRTGADEIWVSNADGTGLEQISKLNHAGTPRWSPDGRKVVFDSRSDGHPSIYIADIEERVPHKLRTNVKEISQPFWSHDGKWIYFIEGATSGRIARCSAEGGEAEVLSNQAGSNPQESFDGDQVYFVTNLLSNPRLMVISLKKPGSESTLEGIPSVNFANWEVVAKGIYFLPHSNWSLEYFDFAAKKVSHLMELSDEPVMGISISRDQRSITYARLQEADSDIMIVENWR